MTLENSVVFRDLVNVQKIKHAKKNIIMPLTI